MDIILFTISANCKKLKKDIFYKKRKIKHISPLILQSLKRFEKDIFKKSSRFRVKRPKNILDKYRTVL